MLSVPQDWVFCFSSSWVFTWLAIGIRSLQQTKLYSLWIILLEALAPMSLHQGRSKSRY